MNSFTSLTIDSFPATQPLPLAQPLPQRPKVSALAKWRLKKAADYVEAHLDESIRLADLAGAVGLTRMHFAAQFRAATGLRPHEFMLRKRVRPREDPPVDLECAPGRCRAQRRLSDAGAFHHGIQAICRRDAPAVAAGKLQRCFAGSLTARLLDAPSGVIRG